MAWFSVVFVTIWTGIVAGVARFAWKQARKWQARGFADNGLGYRIERTAQPRAFAMVCWLYQSFAVLASVFVLFGVFGIIVSALRAL